MATRGLTAGLALLLCAAVGRAGLAGDEGGPKDDKKAPPPSPSGATGIYVLLKNNEDLGSKEAEAILNHHDVTGIAIRTTWKTLEPQEEKYDWSYLDTQIALAQRQGKKVSIHIRTARDGDIQAWLLKKNPGLFVHREGTTIVPWDPVFLEHWTRLLRAFGDRYKDDATVACVNGLTGSVTRGWGMPDEDVDGKGWFDKKYGYTHEKLMHALKQVARAVLAGFDSSLPARKFIFAVGKIGFETPGKRFLAGQEIADFVFKERPAAAVLFREDVYAGTPNPPDSGYWLTVWNYGRKWGGQTGAQFLRAASGEQKSAPLKYLKESEKTPAGIIRATAAVAAAYGMSYLEVYKADFMAAQKDGDLREALKYMHTKLSGSATPASGAQPPATGHRGKKMKREEAP